MTPRDTPPYIPVSVPVFHVRPIPQGGGWQITRDDEPLAIASFMFRHQAVAEARKLRGSEPGEVRVYGLDGAYLFSDTAPRRDG